MTLEIFFIQITPHFLKANDKIDGHSNNDCHYRGMSFGTLRTKAFGCASVTIATEKKTISVISSIRKSQRHLCNL